MANTYDIGDLVTISTVAKNAAGAAADPTTLTLRVKKPDGTATNYTWAGAQVVRDSLGNFHYDVSADQSGQWFFDWTGTGAVQAAEPGEFAVRYRRAA